MKKKVKITKEQLKKQKAIIGDFNDQLEAQEGNKAIDLKTAKEMPKKMWACTPEIKLKASNPSFDLQLSPEQTRGGVIRIVRLGSNRIKICSIVETQYLDDGVAAAKKKAKVKEALAKKKKKTKKKVSK